MAQYPSYYPHSFQQFPQGYQGGYGQGGYGQQGYGGMGQGNPNSLQMILAYLLAQQQEQPQGQEQPSGDPTNPYLLSPFRPMPTGLSPLGRFNDMALRQSASLANRLADGKQAVAESTERQRLVDSITHPPPAAPYSISPAMTPMGGGADLFSRYGTGSVRIGPPGIVPHGTFGPDNLPFGQIAPPPIENLTNYADTIAAAKNRNIHGAQPLGDNPNQETYQQQMILDSIHKALGRKK